MQEKKFIKINIETNDNNTEDIMRMVLGLMNSKTAKGYIANLDAIRNDDNFHFKLEYRKED